MKTTKPQQAPTKPKNLHELLRIVAKAKWRGKSYEMQAYRNVEQFIETVGNLALEEVKTTTIDDFIDALRGEVADSTINRKLANIHLMLKYGYEREWISRMPKFEWKEETEGRVRWLTEAEEIEMFGHLESWGEAAVTDFLRILLDTGLRRGELLKLQAKDVNGDWIRLWVNKTKVARSVPLSVRAKAIIEERGIPRVTVLQLTAVWAKLRTAMGLEDDSDFVLHALRHTAATRTLSKTSNLAIVQKLLGHRKIQTTMRYAHVSDDDLLSAVR
ncbi:integrase [Caballeronia temeraria]|uniref:Integrase n=1 Tax=Caballeronia temeraria TaxID=1777137 RepID=A0A158DN76_9BURK|nr:site-specific integrase [Caballeronia temeraria]SAK95656.1 integrase [Caballeronia temeraria]